MVRRHQVYVLYSLKTKPLLNFPFQGHVCHLGDVQDKDELLGLGQC